jgi:hypothetical protein
MHDFWVPSNAYEHTYGRYIPQRWSKKTLTEVNFTHTVYGMDSKSYCNVCIALSMEFCLILWVVDYSRFRIWNFSANLTLKAFVFIVNFLLGVEKNQNFVSVLCPWKWKGMYAVKFIRRTLCFYASVLNIMTSQKCRILACLAWQPTHAIYVSCKCWHFVTSISFCIMHCKEIWIYVFLEKELHVLSRKFRHSCVCERSVYSHVRFIYFPAAVLADRSGEYINRSQKYECWNWDCSRAVPFVSNFRYCVFAVC